MLRQHAFLPLPLLLACTSLLLACGDDSPNLAVDFVITNPGTGAPNIQPLWPMAVGDYLEGEYVVESKKNSVYRVFEVRDADVSFWLKANDGLAFVASAASGGSSEPLLLVPNEVRDGMAWTTSRGLPGTITMMGEIDTPTGSKRQWDLRVGNADVDQVYYTMTEGYGAVRRISGGVLVAEDSGKGIEIPKSLAPEVLTTPSDTVGLVSFSAIDITGHSFMLLLTRYLRTPQGTDETKFGCFVGDDSPLGGTEFVEDFRLPTLNLCPGRTARDGIGTDRIYSSAENAMPFNGEILWAQMDEILPNNTVASYASYAPHIVGDQYRVYRRHLNSQDVDSLLLGGGLGTPTLNQWGAKVSMDAVAIDFQTTPTPARVILERAGYVQAASIDGTEQKAASHRWYMPGVRSVRTHDAGRDVWVIRPDGALYNLDIIDGQMSFEMAAKLEVISGTPMVAAARRGQQIISGTYSPSFGQMLRIVDAPESQPISLPVSLGFVVTGALPLLYVCPPESVTSLESLELTIDGMPPRYLFRDPGRSDGCAVAIADASAVQPLIGATLPSVGRVTAFVSSSQHVLPFGSQWDARPLRGGGFISGAQVGTIAGSIKRPVRNFTISAAAVAGSYLHDVGGYGIWGAPSGTSPTLRLNDSTHADWQDLPVLARTLNNLGLRSLSSLGRLYLCTTLDDAEPGCLLLNIDGSYEELPQAEILGLIAEIDDGTRCFQNGTQLWCGLAGAPTSSVTLAATTRIFDVLPFKTGFYFRAGTEAFYRYFNVATNSIEVLNMDVGRLFRVSDDRILGIADTVVVDMNGASASAVLDVAPIADEFGLALGETSIVPGLDYVLVNALPIPYQN